MSLRCDVTTITNQAMIKIIVSYGRSVITGYKAQKLPNQWGVEPPLLAYALAHSRKIACLILDFGVLLLMLLVSWLQMFFYIFELLRNQGRYTAQLLCT